MLNFLRDNLSERSKLRLLYHKISAIFANFWFLFPSKKIHIIGVTGTSGKSTTVEIIYNLLQKNGLKTASISTIQFHIGDKILNNESLRTTLRPWQTQKFITEAIKKNCKYLVMEVSSHAIDQNRIWGIDFDTMVLTNIYNNEHLDYHKNFSEYVRIKQKPFLSLNKSYRKANINKTIILNKDDEYFDIFDEIIADKKWTFSRKKSADAKAENIVLEKGGNSFSLRVPNNQINIKTKLIGLHNVENTLAAISVAMSVGIGIKKIAKVLAKEIKIPGRLELVGNNHNDVPICVDFTYKPSALQATLETLRKSIKGNLIVVWGGAGGREPKNWQESAKIIEKFSDEFILTTDDPGETDISFINNSIKKVLTRKEGDRFFTIEDRYEAIRYGIFTAQKNDFVLIAGRGHENIQKIGKYSIQFDDREVVREILKLKI